MEYDIMVGKFGAFFVNKGPKGDGLDEKDSASITPFNTIYSKEVPIMQFTGLFDKNGRKIFEGDIVKGEVQFPQLTTMDSDETCNFKMAGSVYYDHTHFSLKAIQIMCDEKREGMVNYFDFVGDCGEIFSEKEVIGNIYQNADLLK